VKWVGNVAYVFDWRNAYRITVGNLEDHVRDVGADGRIVKWFFKKYGESVDSFI
jgi:hypothetical protein